MTASRDPLGTARLRAEADRSMDCTMSSSAHPCPSTAVPPVTACSGGDGAKESKETAVAGGVIAGDAPSCAASCWGEASKYPASWVPLTTAASPELSKSHDVPYSRLRRERRCGGVGHRSRVASMGQGHRLSGVGCRGCGHGQSVVGYGSGLSVSHGYGLSVVGCRL